MPERHAIEFNRPLPLRAALTSIIFTGAHSFYALGRCRPVTCMPVNVPLAQGAVALALL
jgi:hypothetical protein